MPKRGVQRVGLQTPQSDDELATVGEQDNSDDDVSPDEDFDSEDDGKKKKGGKGRGVNKKQPKPKKILPHNGVIHSLNEMVHKALLYFLLMQHKKLPVKRSEIIKLAMNMQAESFPDVIGKLDHVFGDIFGMRIVGLEESASQRTKTYASYILLSKYTLSMSELVTDRPAEIQCKRSCLFIILTLIFMLGRSIEEETIWSTLESLGFESMVCKKREDLKRFIRSEYVSTMYLHVDEISENERTLLRYSWGPRAELEFSKYAVLKFAARQFPGKKPVDFGQQYQKAKEQECDVVEADEAEAAAHQSLEPALEDDNLPRVSNRSNSSHDLTNDTTEYDEEDPEQIDIDIETDTEERTSFN